MTVYAVDPLEDPRWAELVDADPRASIFHTCEWLDALRRTYGYDPVVYTTSAPAAKLANAVVVCRVRSWLTGRRMVSVPFADHCEALVDSTEASRELSAFLRETVGREKWDYIELRPVGPSLSVEPAFEPSQSFRLHVLDLDAPMDSLFSAMHRKSIRHMVRRAERESVGYEEGRSEALLDRFYALLVLTRRRHQVPPQPIEWFRHLIACMGERLAIRLASKDGRPIAGILTLRHRSTLIYKYGCSDATVHHLGAMPFLFWRTIEEATCTGVRRLDLGRSDLDNTGLIAFKDHLGAASSTLTYVRYSRRRTLARKGSRGMRTAQWMCARMPAIALTAAGRLLYRHIG